MTYAALKMPGGQDLAVTNFSPHARKSFSGDGAVLHTTAIIEVWYRIAAIVPVGS